MDRLSKLAENIKDPNTIINSSLFFAVGLLGGIVFKTQIKKGLNSLGLLSGGRFGSINKTEAGAQKQQELKRGKHPIQLYSLGTPNGQKVTILLEELGLKYDAFEISIMKGDQFTSGFVDINPNSKIPALVDYTNDSEQGQRVFESGNILLYLAEQNGSKFLPTDPKKRTECLGFLFMQMGLGPYIGQYGHFQNYAPKSFWFDHSYAWNRYATEVQRIVSVLDNSLEKNQYLVGDEYTIADIAWYPWINCIREFYKSWEILNLDRFKNVARWMKDIEARPAVKKGRVINQGWVDEKYRNYSSE